MVAHEGATKQAAWEWRASMLQQLAQGSERLSHGALNGHTPTHLQVRSCVRLTGASACGHRSWWCGSSSSSSSTQTMQQSRSRCGPFVFVCVPIVWLHGRFPARPRTVSLRPAADVATRRHVIPCHAVHILGLFQPGTMFDQTGPILTTVHCCRCLHAARSTLV